MYLWMRSGPEAKVAVAPRLKAEIQASRVDIGDKNALIIRRLAELACSKSPIIPAPITRAVSRRVYRCERDRMESDGNRFEHGGLGKGEIVGQAVHDAGGTTTNSAKAPARR